MMPSRRDRMAPEERITAVLHGGVPDRVPVAPFIHYFAARYAGYTQADLWEDHGAYRESMRKTFLDMGPWDASFLLDAHGPIALSFMIPMRARIPGRDLPRNSPMQLMEDEIMGEADYEWILAQPSYGEVAIFGRFLERLAMRIHRRLSVRLRGRVQVAGALLQNAAHNLLDIRMWRSWGITVLYGMGLEAPFDTFSLARSLERFCIDVMRRPEAIREAAERLVAGFVLVARIGCAVTRVPRFVIMCHRSSNDFISPRHFGSLAWPSLREICLRLIRAGIVPILHCDGNWDKNVEYFLQLPERRVCLQFDGRTDIFRASEILGNHCILFGDVPAAMLVMGAPHEIDEYCRRLIGSLGKDGGYILGAGCEIPSDAKAANVHAMIRAARKYGYYG